MSVRDISQTAIANLEYEFVRHLGPTFHGDTLYAESEILEKTRVRRSGDRGVLYVETRAWNQKRRARVVAAPPGPAAAPAVDREPVSSVTAFVAAPQPAAPTDDPVASDMLVGARS